MTTLTLPAHDSKIYQKYNKKSLQNKEKNKLSFCQDFGLNNRKKSLLICLTYPLTQESHIDTLVEIMEGVMELKINLVVTGIGTKKYQDFFSRLAQKYPQQVIIVENNEINKEKIYAASDIFLATSCEKDCLVEMEKAMAHGVVPVTPSNPLVVDYDGAKEEGNAFLYKEKNYWSLFAALVRALENYKFPYDWKTIQKNAIGVEEEYDVEGE